MNKRRRRFCAVEISPMSWDAPITAEMQFKYCVLTIGDIVVQHSSIECITAAMPIIEERVPMKYESATLSSG